MFLLSNKHKLHHIRLALKWHRVLSDLKTDRSSIIILSLFYIKRSNEMRERERKYFLFHLAKPGYMFKNMMEMNYEMIFWWLQNFWRRNCINTRRYIFFESDTTKWRNKKEVLRVRWISKNSLLKPWCWHRVWLYSNHNASYKLMETSFQGMGNW